MKLAEQFSDRTVKKVYFGITWGKWQSMEGTIKESIGRKRNDPTTYQIDVNGRDSQTSYSVKNETVYFSEVNFLPKTGRTHQIRVHSAYLGHPLLGDDKYGGGMNKIKGYIPEITKKLSSLFGSVKRHILHAEKITFIHPNSNSEMVLNAEMPDDIQAVIKQINSLNV